MQVGFEATLGPAGRAEFRLFPPPPAVPGARPLVSAAADPGRGLAAACIGRLFTPAGSASEAETALGAFRDRGLAGLQALRGEFSLVLFDGPGGRLLALRDPVGSWPLYWRGGPEGVTVGTRLRPLAPEGGSALDLDFVADYLVHPFGFDELAVEATPFRGVRRLLPGTLTSLSGTGACRTEARWDWEAEMPDLRGITPAEAGRELARRLDEAVGRRTAEGGLAAHLSGGLDSSSVLYLASRHLQGRTPPACLPALSVVFRHPSLAGERGPMKAVLDCCPAAAPCEVDGEGTPDYDWFGGELPLHDEPCPGLYGVARARRMFEAARQAGACQVLTGGVADEFLLGRRLYLADLFASGRWRSLWREARRCAAAENRSLGEILWQRALVPASPAWLREGPGTFLRRGYGRWPHFGLFAIPPWVRPSFARAHGLAGRFRDVVRAINRTPRWRSENLYKLRRNSGDWGSWYVGAVRGVWNSYPFLDPDVVTFCLALPPAVNDVPGTLKPVLGEAMRGRLPAPVLERRFKANTAATYCAGLARHLPGVIDLVRRSRLADGDIFDPEILLRAVREHAQGVGSVSFMRLTGALALVAWYEQVDSPRWRDLPAPQTEFSVGPPGVRPAL
jgi:asparagine synthase (glutamine-hydrolysing)